MFVFEPYADESVFVGHIVIEVFVVDAETLAEAVKKAGYAYAEEYGWDNRFSDFNLYLQEELGDHIKEVGADEISRRSDSGE